MKSFVVLLLLATAACSRGADRVTPPPPASATSTATTTSASSLAPTPLRPPARTELTITSTGESFGLRVEAGTVSFCDKRGGRKLDPATGKDTAFERTCTKDPEANVACGGLSLDVEVSTPSLGPNDVVDVGGNRFPLDGRVHDCAADAKTLAAVTGSAVVIIDTAKGTTDVIDHHGGDRVAIGMGWVAWSSGSSIRARRR